MPRRRRKDLVGRVEDLMHRTRIEMLRRLSAELREAWDRRTADAGPDGPAAGDDSGWTDWLG